MAAKPLPDADLLRQLLRYEPDTGKLFWKERASQDGFKSKRSWLTWNAKYAGKEAFTCDNGLGYPSGMVLGKGYKAHRIIWKIATGFDPICIDHINGDRSDNRLCNLRSVEKRDNNLNCAAYKNNTSGCHGVTFRKGSDVWWVRISINGIRKHVGYFKKKEDAIRARKAAERQLGFHPNHGRKK